MFCVKSLQFNLTYWQGDLDLENVFDRNKCFFKFSFIIKPTSAKYKTPKNNVNQITDFLKKLLNLVHQKPAATNLAKLTSNDPSDYINLQSTYDVDCLILPGRVVTGADLQSI